jgi:uncharacterized protein (TIGR02118 family)
MPIDRDTASVPPGIGAAPDKEIAMSARFLVLWETPSDEAAFERHYHDVHIPLAHTLPGLRSYTISRNVAAVRGPASYVVGELEFDDLDALRHAFSTDQGRACAADVNKLSELAEVRSMTYETVETYAAAARG